MKRFALAAAAILSISAFAQARVEVVVPPPPSVRFEVQPPLVQVQPGIQVVPQSQDEVFLHDGWYWTRRGGRWWRARDWRGGWAVMEPRYVPAPLYRIPEGRYRMWREEQREQRREWHDQERMQRERAREQQREWHEQQREQQRERGEQRREGREPERERDHEYDRGERRRERGEHDDR